MLEITLKQLEAFVCVADCGSFYEAALRLYVSQPTVSSHIAMLEKHLDLHLLERGSRKKVALTEEGREVYRRAKGILESCRALENAYTTGGELVLGASSIPMGYLLPPIMSAFQKELPNCRFVLKEGDSTAIHALLQENQIQIGLVGTVLYSEQLTYRRLCSDELVLITQNTAEYRAFLQQGVVGTALLDRPLILRSAGSGTQKAVDRFLAEKGINMRQLTIAANVESNETMLELAGQGAGNAILSSLAARAWQAAGRVLCFPLDSHPIRRDLYLAWKKQAALSMPAKRFIAMATALAESNALGTE